VSEDSLRRRLAAIMSADVKDYSRLMRQDEAATVMTLKSYREMMAMLVAQHHGRVVDSPGDNMLAEFGSVVDAVQSAVAIQKELGLRNTELEPDRRMEYRIGINLGDVISDGERIYGDGVNIAARLEGLAEPGGICISRTAYDQIEDKLPFGYEYLGEREVKNIARPVPAYKVLLDPNGPTRSSEAAAQARSAGPTEARRPEETRGLSEKEKAEKEEVGFFWHLRTYIAVMVFLFFIDIITGGGLWFFWVAAPWGLALFFHWSSVQVRRRYPSAASPKKRDWNPRSAREVRRFIRRRVKERVHGEAGDLKYLRLQVEPKAPRDSRHGRVNMRVPLSLLRTGVKLGAVLPEHAKDKINAALRDKGLDIDLWSLEGEELEALLVSLSEVGIEVDEQDQVVHIFVE